MFLMTSWVVNALMHVTTDTRLANVAKGNYIIEWEVIQGHSDLPDDTICLDRAPIYAAEKR